MINTLLNHKIRKDTIKENKKHNHRQYLSALFLGPKIKYWAGYHKKKLIFLGLIALISWNYDLHTSLMHSLLSIRSPRDMLAHLLFNSEKVQKTVNEQKIVGWNFGQRNMQLLTKLFYQADKQLIFGVGRHYLFQVYSNMGLLQKKQDITIFWNASSFYKRRNQMVAGVSYKQFMILFSEGYKTLLKSEPQLTRQEYLRRFVQLFIQKGTVIQKWQKEFNKKRYQQFLKNLLTDNEKKSEQISILMRQNVQISEEEVQKKLEQSGMKGMGIKDKWFYWKNRQILISLRQFNLHKRLNMIITEGRQRAELQKKLTSIQEQLKKISKVKQQLKEKYRNYYEQQLI